MVFLKYAGKMKNFTSKPFILFFALTGLVIPQNMTLSAAEPWHIDFVNASGAVFGTQTRTITVAIIDDGIDSSDSDLRGLLWRNDDEILGNATDDDHNGYINDTFGWNFIGDSNDIAANGYHGSDVARAMNSILESAGVQSSFRFMPLVVTSEHGVTDPAVMRKAIRYAVDNGAHIINVSIGGTTLYYSADFDATVRYAYDHKVLIVAAAGNGATEDDAGVNLNAVKLSPVCNDGDANRVLGVGALDTKGYAASWSNTGRCVDIFAPGEKIMLTADAATYEVSGTSFAASIVSGIAAVLSTRSSLRGAALRDHILNTTRSSHGLQVPDLSNALQELPGQINNALIHTVSDGALIRIASSPAVYLIQSGMKRHIVNERVFLANGYSWNSIRTVTDDSIALPSGTPVTFTGDDKDRDGLTATEEIACNTDPLNDDSDHDGYLDGQEVRNGYNPLGIGKGVTCS